MKRVRVKQTDIGCVVPGFALTDAQTNLINRVASGVVLRGCLTCGHAWWQYAADVLEECPARRPIVAGGKTTHINCGSPALVRTLPVLPANRGAKARQTVSAGAENAHQRRPPKASG